MADIVRAWYLDGGTEKATGILERLHRPPERPVDPARPGLHRRPLLSYLLAVLGRCQCLGDGRFCGPGLALLAAVARDLSLSVREDRREAAPKRRVWSLRAALCAGAIAISLFHSLTLLFSRPRLLLLTTVLSLLVQGSNVILLWLIARAINAPLPASYCGIVVPMVTLLTLVPVSLNGMGVREGGMVLFLTPVGIAHGHGLSLAFLWFSVFVAVSLFGAGVFCFETWSVEGGARAHHPLCGKGHVRAPRSTPST